MYTGAVKSLRMFNHVPEKPVISCSMQLFRLLFACTELSTTY